MIIVLQPVLTGLSFQFSLQYGDAEDAFKETAEKVGELKTDLIVAEVGTQDYGDSALPVLLPPALTPAL